MATEARLTVQFLEIIKDVHIFLLEESPSQDESPAYHFPFVAGCQIAKANGHHAMILKFV